MVAVPEQAWFPAAAKRRWSLDLVVGTLLLALGGLAVVAGFLGGFLGTARRIEATPVPTPEDLRAELSRWDRVLRLGGVLALLGCGSLLVHALRARAEGERARQSE